MSFVDEGRIQKGLLVVVEDSSKELDMNSLFCPDTQLAAKLDMSRIGSTVVALFHWGRWGIHSDRTEEGLWREIDRRLIFLLDS